MSGAPILTAHELVKRFGDLEAVKGISFAIDRGESFGFLGPNGAGKTSTMRMISAVSQPTSGDLSSSDSTRERTARRSADASASSPRRTPSSSSSRFA